MGEIQRDKIDMYIEATARVCLECDIENCPGKDPDDSDREVLEFPKGCPYRG